MDIVPGGQMLIIGLSLLYFVSLALAVFWAYREEEKRNALFLLIVGGAVYGFLWSVLSRVLIF